MNESVFEIARRLWAFLCAIITSTVLYFYPIHDVIEILSGAFVVSFALGVYNSIVLQHETLSKTKGFKAFKEVVLYVLCLAGLFVVGDKMHASGAMLHIISTITWCLIYLYMSNIFKNLNRIFPYSKGIRLIYYILSLEFLKYFPLMKGFEEQEKKNEKSK